MRFALGTFALVSIAPLTPITVPAREIPLAVFEDYRTRAGTLRGDTLVVALDVSEVRWRPEGRQGSELNVWAFVERGKPARVPGPLLRVSSGTFIRVMLRNTSDQQFVVFGLQDHPAGRLPDSLALAPGVEGTVTFRATAPGNYYYWGRTRIAGAKPHSFDAHPGGADKEGPLVGALIVDPVGAVPARHERILMLTRWYDGKYRNVSTDGTWKTMVNGGSWPNTERLSYVVGDTVVFRVLNPIFVHHPMHLHGFYFDVTARGDGRLDTLYATGARRTVVTELMDNFGTMTMAWVPERAGNWLFHCHLIRHMNLGQRIPDSSASGHGAHVTLASAADHRAENHMAGLVMGIHVRPRPGADSAEAVRRAVGADKAPANERALRLVATTRPGVFGDKPGYSFVLQQGTTAPADDSIRIPGSPIVLTRGEPARITVVNRIGTPLAVHWHGMEIESWFDGVGGWSGAGASVRPSIAPGDSFIVRMTPPRAGTFIYHTHDETGDQLGMGLYGALLVVDRDVPRDTTRDHVIVLGLKGPNAIAPLAVNGEPVPLPLRLTPNLPHRLRLVSIPADEVLAVELVRSDSVQQSWRPLAVDGAELPASQQVARSARVRLSAGQTTDVGVVVDDSVSQPGRYALRIRTTFYPANGRRPEVTIVPILAP